MKLFLKYTQLDVSILATSDRNKPLLVDFIPLLVTALESSAKNARLAKFSVKALAELYFHSDARVKIEGLKHRLVVELSRNHIYRADLETYQLASMLRTALDSVPRTVEGSVLAWYSRSSARIARLARRVVSFERHHYYEEEEDYY